MLKGAGNGRYACRLETAPLEKSSQFAEGAGDALLSSIIAHAERGSDVAEGLVFVKAQQQRGAIFFTQRQERLVQQRDEGAQSRLVFRGFHGGAQFGGGLFTAAAADFAAEPLFGFEQGRFVKPRRQGIVCGKVPGLLDENRKYVLRDLLRRKLFLHLTKSGGINQVQMPLHDAGEGLLVAVSDKGLQ